MEKAKVSVIIPAYNASQYLPKCLDSVLIQNVDAEIIVIDDGSSDQIRQVIEKYQSCPQLRYVRNKENIGAAASRNLGVNMSEGKYVAFLDADDWWEPGKLRARWILWKRQAQYLPIRDAGYIMGISYRSIGCLNLLHMMNC